MAIGGSMAIGSSLADGSSLASGRSLTDGSRLADGGGTLAGGGGSLAAEGSGLAGQVGGLADEELGAVAGHEDSRVHGYPQPAELGPADDVFDGHPGGSPVHHGGEVGGRLCRGDEQPRLVLGEDAAGRPEPADDDGGRAR